ncbi:MAG: NAD(P)-dependent oxidoreductase [Bacillota bacterium]|nr:NAD(P)-dependent oxidoreductase [Bacillota bacterium]
MINVWEENKRCLQCKKPSCEKGCPVDTPIKEVIQLLKENKIKEAGKLLFDNNPLSVVTSLICPHEDFCVGHCVLSHKGSPVQTCFIENYTSDYFLNTVDFEPEINPEKKVAIIGSGPAGLTMAILLARKGYDITIFESHEEIGGVLRYGIPEFRLPKSILDRYYEILIKMGVKIRPNTLIGTVITLDDMFRDGYKAIFVASGTWKPRKLNIPGESLGHVYYAIDYLRSPNTHNLGKKVCVIGGGNVALDCARTAIRKGAKEVTVYYRKGEADMPSSKEEINYAKLDGVSFEFYRSPVEIKDKYIKFKVTDPLQENEDLYEEVTYDADSVIISISQGPRSIIADSTRGVKLDKLGLIVIDETGKTTKEGVFAAGDVVTGAKTVVEAVAATKIVAKYLDEYVTEKYNL